MTTEYVTPNIHTENIHTVLKKYQNTAPKSLQGPGHALVAAATAGAVGSAGGCSGGLNCPLDASINSSDLPPSGNCRTLSPCLAANLTTLPNGLVVAGNCVGGGGGGGVGKQISAVAFIKKEILTSPEPLPLSTQSKSSTLSSSASALSAHGHGIVDMQQQHAAISPPTIKIVPPPPPELSQPILSAADSCSGELYETRLEGKTIGCFSLGGEMRLCLPQFLNNVLGDFTLDQINRIFDELGIFCSQCTPDQLLEFKAAKILPSDVKASGLITRTDAERLCAALLHRTERSSYMSVDIPKSAISFKVYHRCFGKCEGICTPDMYSYQNPTCIMCLECKGWFSPQKFVGHVHRKVENRTCHWGFDSRNWHDYLHVALDVENREKYQKILDQLKEVEIKESLKQQHQREIIFMKRKGDIPLDDVLVGSTIAGAMLHGMAPAAAPHQLLAPGKQRSATETIVDIPTKKSKNLDEASAYQLEYQRYQTLMYAHCAQQQQRMGSMSAFRPWAPSKNFLQAAAAVSYNAAVVGAFSTLPYLSQEPPVLQNPERVVRNADRERFERTYQPNVALAPRKIILSKEREKEQRERERERIDREREKELERVRDRERERLRERERERERERQRESREVQQQQQQQHHKQQQQLQQLFQPCGGICTNLCEAELHIKQERSNTPQSPLPLFNNGDDDAMDRRSGSALHEEATMPMISPVSLGVSMSQQHQSQQNQHQQQLKSDSHEMTQRRHSLHTSNSSSTCSTSSSTTPPEQQLLPACLPPSLPSQSQMRHLQHAALAQQHLRQSPRTPSPPTNFNKNNNKTNNNNNNNNSTSRISLDEFASSNEITSSTSPDSNHIRQQQQQQHHQASHQQHGIQQHPLPAHVQSIITTVNQHTKLLPATTTTTTTATTAGLPPTYNNSNNEVSSRIRINKNLMRSPTPPPPPPSSLQQRQDQMQQKQYEYLKEKQHHHQQQQQRIYAQQRQQHQQQHFIRHQQQQQQHHSPTQSSSGGGLNLSTSAINNNSKHQNQAPHLNGGLYPPQQSHMGSEFELSTDTDDDGSVNGEPDSSNMLAPWETAVEALRDTRPKDRERVLQLLQRLLHENQQYRYNNLQLSEILQKRDAHICELREQIQNYRRQLEIERKQRQQQQQTPTDNVDNGSVIVSKIESYQNEELRVPLKKSVRRDPEQNAIAMEEMKKERNNISQSNEMDEISCGSCGSENVASTVSKNTKAEGEFDGDVIEEESKDVDDEIENKAENKIESIKLESPIQRRNGAESDVNINGEQLTNGRHDNDQQDETSRFSDSDNATNDAPDSVVDCIVKKDVETNNVGGVEEEDEDGEDMDNDEMDDENDEEVQRNCNEQNSQSLVQAPHTSAAVIPPTATTPISPDSAATAGQLFDSSNSSDDSSMKKAQMSASNALAKISEAVTAEEENEREECFNTKKQKDDADEDEEDIDDVDDDNDDNDEANVGDENEHTKTNVEIDADDSNTNDDSMDSEDFNGKVVRCNKRQYDLIDDAQKNEKTIKKCHQESTIIIESSSITKATPTRLDSNSPTISNSPPRHKLHATTIPPTTTCTVPPNIFKPIVTKASRKQTPASPTTNSDLQIKKEIF